MTNFRFQNARYSNENYYFTSFIIAHVSRDWPPCFRSSHKGLDTREWACATPDDPHHVQLLLQFSRTAMDEGPEALRPQVCADWLQRGAGGLQRFYIT
jgi:hypothetical protein